MELHSSVRRLWEASVGCDAEQGVACRRKKEPVSRSTFPTCSSSAIRAHFSQKTIIKQLPEVHWRPNDHVDAVK